MSDKLLTRLRAGGAEPTQDEPPSAFEAAFAAYAEWLERLRTDVAGSLNGVVLRGAMPYPLIAGQNARPTVSGGTLVGWSLRETTGAAPATLVFYNGRDQGADEIASVTLVAGESTRDWFGPGGINIGPEGLYVRALTGSVLGAVYLGAVQ